MYIFSDILIYGLLNLSSKTMEFFSVVKLNGKYMA